MTLQLLKTAHLLVGDSIIVYFLSLDQGVDINPVSGNLC
jgi:hypothetical protein